MTKLAIATTWQWRVHQLNSFIYYMGVKVILCLRRFPSCHSFHYFTAVQNSQELGRKYWATRSSIRSLCSFTGSALLASHGRSAALIHLLARSLTPKLEGNWMIRCLKTTWFVPQCVSQGHQINDMSDSKEILGFFSHPWYLLPTHIDLCGLDLSNALSPEILHELCLFEGLPMPSSRALMWLSAS